QRFGRARDQKTTGVLHVLGGESLANVAGGDPERGHAIEIDLDTDGALPTTTDLHLADAVDGFQALANGVVRVLVELLQGAIGLQRNPQHGAGAGLDLGHYRRVGIVGQLAQNLVDLGLHLVESDVDVLVELEGDDHVRYARRRARLDVVDARRAVDRTF